MQLSQGKKHPGTNKRLLSTALSFLMIMLLLPVGNLHSEALETVYNYNFLKLGTKGAYLIANIDDYKYTTAGSDDEINSSIPSSPWKYTGMGNKDVPGTSGGARFNYEGPTSGANLFYTAAAAADYVGVYASIMINVPESGIYRADSVMGLVPNGGIANIYLAPDGVSTPRDESYRIAVIDTYKSTASYNQKVRIGYIGLSAGDHILTYEIAGKHPDASYAYLFVSQLQLTAVTLSLSAEDPGYIFAGSTKNADLSAEWSDGQQEDLTGLSISANSRDTSIATAEVITNQETGRKSIAITGAGAGSTTIDVTVSNGASQFASCAIPVMIREAAVPTPQKYNFLKLCLRREYGWDTPEALANNNKGVDITTVTSFTQMTMGHDNLINKNNPEETSPWYYSGFGTKSGPGASGGARFRFESSTFGVQLWNTTANYQGTYGSIVIDVPADGLYQTSATIGYTTTGGIVRFYLAPLSEADPRSMQYSLGSCDTYSSTSRWTENTLLRTIPLTAGSYIVSFELIDKNDNAQNAYFHISDFRLNPVGETPTLGLDIDAVTDISKGQSVERDIIAVWSDGAMDDLLGYTISAVSRDTDIAEAGAETNTSNSKNKLTVAAKSAGSTVIDVTVSKDSDIVTELELPVIINPVSEVFAGGGQIKATATDSSSGAAINGAVTGSLPDFSQDVINEYGLGSEITLTAAMIPGKTFRYWKSETSKRIVSTENSFSFKVGSNTYITAVYSEPQQGQYLIEFIDRNGRVLKSDYINKNQPIVKPENPFSVGYVFDDWDPVVPETATKNQTFIARYNLSPETYELTLTGPAAVIGGSLSPYAYNSRIEVTVDNESLPDGMSFACWKRDGRIISYAPTYCFYMWDDTTVEAVCVPNGTTVAKAPQIFMDSVKKLGSILVFASERGVPEGFELIESGILIKQDSYEEESFKLDGSYDYKAVSQNYGASGQFTVRRDDAAGVWYARAYLIYKYGNDVKVIYSDIVSESV